MAPQTLAWKRLVRYVGADGSVKYGEPILPKSSDDVSNLFKQGNLEVHICEGTDIWSATPTREKEVVKKLLGPLDAKNVPIIRCIGLNYKTHSEYNSCLML